eukprot:gene8234-10833_t
MAVYDGEQLRTEAHFVDAAMHSFWVEHVFHQHPATPDLPKAPAGYDEF